ncbi:hypothetical protein D3C81_2053450 [compost metagenome]
MAQDVDQAVDLGFGVQQARCGTHDRPDIAIDRIDHDALAVQVRCYGLDVLALDPEEGEAR